MLLNFNAPRIIPNAIQSTNNFDPYAALGFQPSQYDGFLQKDNLFVKDGGLYEAYDVPPTTTQYFRDSIGGPVPVTGQFGMPYQPSYNPIFGYGGGINVVHGGGPVEGTVYSGDQAFKPYSGDAPYGFIETDGKFSLSPATISSLRPTYMPTAPVSSPLSLTSPTAFNAPTGNFGAGRFLNTGNLLGFNFTPAQTTSSVATSPAI